MIRFGINEYIRNFWYNLCVILIMLVMMVTATILISNIDEETGVYRLADQYIDDDSIFVTRADSGFIKELSNMKGKVRAVEMIDGCFEIGADSNIRAMVYTEEVMKYLAPRLESGVYPQRTRREDNTIDVLISQNPYDIKTGDTFTFNIYGKESDAYISVEVYVAGIISEGQRLYTELNSISNNMTYEDFFPVYSYEQTQQVRMIIPEEEMEKIPEVQEVISYGNIMIDPSDDLSEENQNVIWEKAAAYEEERMGAGSMSIYPEASDLVERSETKYNSMLIKYVPLFIIVVLLFGICIIGIVSIKTVKSIRYYGIMYAYGMPYSTAQFMTGFEIAFNSIIAFLGTVSLLTLQNALDLVGKINCNLDSLELLIMLAIIIVTIISSIFTTGSVLKEKTPVEILKNKV